jgi:hypothetical protein
LVRYVPISVFACEDCQGIFHDFCNIHE